MPFYDYCCKNCEHEITILQKRTDPNPNSCLKCGSNAMQRQISSCGFSLAGSGWYKDGYSSEAAPAKEIA